MPVVQFPDFMAITCGLVAYLIGEAINNRIPLLRHFNIPDPVTGGLLVAVLLFALHECGDRQRRLRHPHPRPPAAHLLHRHRPQRPHLRPPQGGRPLAILVGLTAVLLIVQNLVGLLAAWAAGLPLGLGVVLGSTSLLGGHGTIIAWSPELAARGLAGGPEIGIAMATLGLVVASVIGGPIGRFLIEGRGLTSTDEAPNPVGLSEPPPEPVTRNALMRTLLVVFICIILGFVAAAGRPRARPDAAALRPLPARRPPRRQPPLARPLRPPGQPHRRPLARLRVRPRRLPRRLAHGAAALGARRHGRHAPRRPRRADRHRRRLLALLAFRLLGRDYQAAVLTAGYSSFVIGATPTAIATMTAVTKRYGPCQHAFIVLPLVSAVFVDIANAFVTQGFLDLFAR